MADEVTVEGRHYISSKRASASTGYAQDYIGQLARKGLIDAQRIGGLWYVSEDSLRGYKGQASSYKPTPPLKKTRPSTDMDAIVSFDGKDYISASRAAEVTGYHQDYVSQLARESKILSRQVGNRWYVERSGVVAHKREKDSLLAAVQAESVGLYTPKPGSELPGADSGAASYFTYTAEDGDLIPLSSKKEIVSEEAGLGTPENKVPIRVLRDVVDASANIPVTSVSQPPVRRRGLKLALAGISVTLATVVIVFAVGYASSVGNASYASMSLPTKDSAVALVGQASEVISRIGGILEGLLVPEMVYSRY